MRAGVHRAFFILPPLFYLDRKDCLRGGLESGHWYRLATEIRQTVSTFRHPFDRPFDIVRSPPIHGMQAPVDFALSDVRAFFARVLLLGSAIFRSSLGGGRLNLLLPESAPVTLRDVFTGARGTPDLMWHFPLALEHEAIDQAPFSSVRCRPFQWQMLELEYAKADHFYHWPLHPSDR